MLCHLQRDAHSRGVGPIVLERAETEAADVAADELSFKSSSRMLGSEPGVDSHAGSEVMRLKEASRMTSCGEKGREGRAVIKVWVSDSTDNAGKDDRALGRGPLQYTSIQHKQDTRNRQHQRTHQRKHEHNQQANEQ